MFTCLLNFLFHFIRNDRLNVILFVILQSVYVSAQRDSVWRIPPSISLSGYVDAFYSYDFNRPESSRQPFLYNHNRHNQLALNTILIQVGLTQEKYRMKIGLHSGTYALDNYAGEPLLYQFIYQANVGISISKKNRLWLDAGVLPSHLGFETALSIENATLTRSLVSENSPYYLTGAKITYSPNEKWELAGIICNGWQQIQRTQGSSIPAGGTQLIFKPSTKTVLNWSTFISSDYPDSIRKMRYYSNLYAQFQPSPKVKCIVGFDFGLEQQQKGSQHYSPWFTPVLITQYTFHPKWALTFRAEYYQDKRNVIIPQLTNPGFSTFGASINADYRPIPQIACRLEGRMFLDEHSIYPTLGSSSRSNFFVTASLAIQLEKTWK
jgi:hypothetical protein